MKLVKLSVAAAMAAGLATSASAVELTEAIKGVDLSGYVRYRLENLRGDQVNNTAGRDWVDVNDMHRYKYRFNFTMPVNDDVNAVLLFGNQTNQDLNNGGPFDGGDGEAYLSDEVYANGNFGVAHAYFQYTGVENLVVQAGKQALPTPFNDDEHGNGIVGLYTVGPVTIAAGHFDSTNTGFGSLDTDKHAGAAALNSHPGDNITAAGVIGSIEMINFDVWAAKHQNYFRAYTVGVEANIADMVNVGARHTNLKLDDDALQLAANADTKNTLTKVYADADIEMINVRAGYAFTGEEGGVVNYDGDAETGFNLEQADLAQLVDAKAYHVGVGATFGKVTVGLDYVRGSYNGTDDTAPVDGTGNLEADFREFMPSVSYAMSDNFNVSALYSKYKEKNRDNAAGVDQGDIENTLTRVQVMYTF